MTAAAGAKTFAIVGPFPPPRNGVSTVNEAVARMAKEGGAAVVCFNTSPPSFDRSVTVRAWRLGRVLKAIIGVWSFAGRNHGGMAYFSLSGGVGLVYEAIGALAARARGASLAVHHHSYRYIDAPYWAMGLLLRAAGDDALHIVLSEEMGAALRRRYPNVRRLFSLSNAAFVSVRPQVSPTSMSPLRRIGYLSNLSRAKGMNELLDTAELSARQGLPLQFLVAGPFEDPLVESEFRRRAQPLKNVRYVGSVYGPDKDAFFEGIDAFIFPTRYRHEAEPIVVLEALSWGCPVIAYARGCIPSLLAEGAGLAIPTGSGFAEPALEELQAWVGEGERFLERRARAQRQFSALKDAGSHRSLELMKLLANATHN